jgi:hypothetical protein
MRIMGRMNTIAERIAAGAMFDGLAVAAGWMEDCVSMVAGRSEEVRNDRGISVAELEGALHGLEAEQRLAGRDDNLGEISKEIQALVAEVDGLNRLKKEVAKRMAVKLAAIERNAVSIQNRLMDARR